MSVISKSIFLSPGKEAKDWNFFDERLGTGKVFFDDFLDSLPEVPVFNAVELTG